MSYLKDILAELNNMKGEHKETPVVWSKDVQKRLQRTDHWGKTGKPKEFDDSQFQDADFSDIDWEEEESAFKNPKSRWRHGYASDDAEMDNYVGFGGDEGDRFDARNERGDFDDDEDKMVDVGDDEDFDDREEPDWEDMVGREMNNDYNWEEEEEPDDEDFDEQPETRYGSRHIDVGDEDEFNSDDEWRSIFGVDNTSDEFEEVDGTDMDVDLDTDNDDDSDKDEPKMVAHQQEGEPPDEGHAELELFQALKQFLDTWKADHGEDTGEADVDDTEDFSDEDDLGFDDEDFSDENQSDEPEMEPESEPEQFSAIKRTLSSDEEQEEDTDMDDKNMDDVNAPCGTRTAPTPASPPCCFGWRATSSCRTASPFGA